VTRYILAILLLSTPALADGPDWSLWHIDGHGYQWQQAQLDAGLPLASAVKLPHWPRRASPGEIAEIAPVAAWDGRDITLRIHNVAGLVDATTPRLPKPLAEEQWTDSVVRLFKNPDGTINDADAMSAFGSPEKWRAAGAANGATPFMQALFVHCPNPVSVTHLDNNESGLPQHAELYVRQNVRVLNSSGKLVQASVNTDPARYADPVGPQWFYRIEPDGPKAYRWRTRVELDSYDLGAWSFVEPRLAVIPPDSKADYDALKIVRANAYFAGFQSMLPTGWQAVPFRTIAYGNVAESWYADANSMPMYLGSYRSPILTDPSHAVDIATRNAEWAAIDAESPGNLREWSISCRYKANSTYDGAVTGAHAVIDPASYAAWNVHLAWAAHTYPNADVTLREWQPSHTEPGLLFYGNSLGVLSQKHIDALASIGRADMLTLTVEDYELATLRALDRIHDHPTINRYWREGSTTVLASPQNDATANRVYATETSIPGETATLLYVYTPCDLTGEIQVGGWTVRAKRLGDWLTGSVQEIE
jgi:hypothetical protein